MYFIVPEIYNKIYVIILYIYNEFIVKQIGIFKAIRAMKLEKLYAKWFEFNNFDISAAY